MDPHPNPREIEILYTDPQGDMAKRRILPVRIFFGMIPGHLHEQWVLEARDVENAVNETLALKDIHAWLPHELQTTPF